MRKHVDLDPTFALVFALLAGAATVATAQPSAQRPPEVANDWPGYNRTLTGERFAALAEIGRANVARLRVLCTFDTGEETSFQSGLIQADGMLIGTTEFDIFALEPDTCQQRWRTHEVYTPASPLKVNRGAAYLDGRLFRGTLDGRVLAYDARTGKRVWEIAIADPARAETVPAAPIAWRAPDGHGLVFIGNAGGDTRGVKGRMYALDAATGAIRWEAYMVPRTASDPARGPAAPQPALVATSWRNAPGLEVSGGNWTSYTLDPATGTLYVPGGNPAPDFAATGRDGENLFTGAVAALDARTGAHRATYKMVAGDDAHDWDVASPAVVTTTRRGARTLLVAPKDGYLYAFALATGRRRFRTVVTTITNADAPITAAGTRFCPGTRGGSEWNGPAYDPTRDLVYTGEVDWCSTVRMAPPAEVRAVPDGRAWTGMKSDDPSETYGVSDPVARWAGRVAATDASTGRVRWQFRAPAPIVGGVTPTAGGVVLFGDLGGSLYALDSDTGRPLWSRAMGGALGGGVIAYATAAGQRVAAAVGMTSPIWPTTQATARATAKVVVLGVR